MGTHLPPQAAGLRACDDVRLLGWAEWRQVARQGLQEPTRH